MSARSLSQITLLVEPAHWHSVRSETRWAAALAPGTYRLENSPFYARGYSYLDVMIAERVDGELHPVVRSVLRKSGHSTYALWVEAGVTDNDRFAEFWKPLDDMGCRYEGSKAKLLSVDVPAETDIRHAFHLLMSGQANGVWLVQEQDVGHDLST